MFLHSFLETISHPLGAYAKGSDRELDEAIARMPKIERFLRQDPQEKAPFDDTVRGLVEAVR